MLSRTPSSATRSPHASYLASNNTYTGKLRIHDVKEMFAAMKDHAGQSVAAGMTGPLLASRKTRYCGHAIAEQTVSLTVRNFAPSVFRQARVFVFVKGMGYE
jgi:hypothetical protein